MNWDESEYSKEVNDKRVKEFTEKLKALLTEYKVEIELEEDSRSWSGSTYDINFSFVGYIDGEEYVSYRDVDLGNNITGGE